MALGGCRSNGRPNLSLSGRLPGRDFETTLDGQDVTLSGVFRK